MTGKPKLLSMLDLKTIQAREEATTQGSWELVNSGNTVSSLKIPGVCSGISPKTSNGEFIANARTDIIKLLAHIEAQEILLAQAESLLCVKIGVPSLPRLVRCVKCDEEWLETAEPRHACDCEMLGYYQLREGMTKDYLVDNSGANRGEDVYNDVL